MKKFIVFIIAAIILAVSAISCGNSVKSDFVSFIGTEVKDVSVKEIPIKGTFYEYIESYTDKTEMVDALNSLVESQRGLYEVYSEGNSAYDKKMAEHWKKTYEDNISRSKSIQASADSIKANFKNGKLYAIKFKEKDESGIWGNHNAYRIMMYDENGQFSQYTGKYVLKVLDKAYPKAKEDLAKDLIENLPSMFTE